LRESILDIIRREFPLDFDIFTNADFLPSIRRRPQPAPVPVRPPPPVAVRVEPMKFAVSDCTYLPHAPMHEVDPKVITDRFHESMSLLSQAVGPVNSISDLIDVLRRSEDVSVMTRLEDVLSRPLFKSLVFQVAVKAEEPIPRKRQRIESSSKAVPPPQLSRNFVKKPPPPLDTLVDGARPKSALDEVDRLNPPAYSFSPALLQTIQLAALGGKILTDRESKIVFKLITEKLKS